MGLNSTIQGLLASEEPSVRYKVRVFVLGECPDGSAIRGLQEQIRESPRVKQLLSNRLVDGTIAPVHHVYRKWIGAHWILATLGDIGYPPGDESLLPAIHQVLDCWLHPDGIRERIVDTALPSHRDRGVPIINGRARRCASQQGNALFSTVALGFVEEKASLLAQCLIRWQWPDGGWNCDRKPEAIHSSFWESLIPLRGLAAYAEVTGDKTAKAACRRAAEVFLRRHLYRREADGGIMNPDFVLLHYPCYWRYDILFALKVMSEAGCVCDPRCRGALDLLESKCLRDGGWPAEARFYRTAARATSGCDLVRWGPVNKRRMNEWVTADALAVLKAAGRLAL